MQKNAPARLDPQQMILGFLAIKYLQEHGVNGGIVLTIEQRRMRCISPPLKVELLLLRRRCEHATFSYVESLLSSFCK